MAAKSYALNFAGYRRVPNIDGLPAKSGIYCVYACTYNKEAKTVSIRELLYIGEAGDVKGRVPGHERWGDWEDELVNGEELCFSAALIAPEEDRQRAEAAMIFRHKPTCNVEYADSFPFDQTTISTTGKNAKLASSFTVNRTP